MLIDRRIDPEKRRMNIDAVPHPRDADSDSEFAANIAHPPQIKTEQKPEKIQRMGKIRFARWLSLVNSDGLGVDEAYRRNHYANKTRQPTTPRRPKTDL